MSSEKSVSIYIATRRHILEAVMWMKFDTFFGVYQDGTLCHLPTEVVTRDL
jgi:hypothetical protein